VAIAAASGGDRSDSAFGKFSAAMKSVSINELILFTKQFRSMMQAGVPILRILQILENQTENKILKNACGKIGDDIRSGSTLYLAMKKYPSTFSPLYLSMINAGEISGALPGILERLIVIIEHEAKIKADIKSALQYPKMVVGALGVAFFVLLTFVIPKFVSIFAKVGMDLPLPTKIAMSMYNGLADYWHVMLGGVILVVFASRAWFKTAEGRYQLDAFFLKLPLFGPLFQKAAMSRFASIFAILLSSGVPVIQALEVLSGTIGNTAISRELEGVREKIREGQGISVPLGTARYFTPMVVSMIAIGEESGRIDEMLREISIHYDDEVGYAVKKLSDNIGPILLVGLAAVVGFFALAIYMPMWDMTKMAK
jgi:type IV pilus assembly protein PilC